MIAVLSDSHIPARAEEIPAGFLEVVKDAELAVHCGDFETPEIKQELEQYNDLVAVKGNCDRFDLPNSETFERGGVSFGVYHGTGIRPRGHRPTLVETARKLGVEVLLTGHTHQQEAYRSEGRIVLNPGSCTGVGGGTASPGNPEMLKIETGEKLSVELLTLQDGELMREEKSFEVQGK